MINIQPLIKISHPLGFEMPARLSHPIAILASELSTERGHPEQRSLAKRREGSSSSKQNQFFTEKNALVFTFRFRLLYLLLPGLFFLFSCNSSQPSLLEKMDSSDTGINFTNQIIADDSLNLLNQTNMYNGAGVAIGDLNGDSLPDLVLAGNQVPLKAFLNRGNWKFEDITQKSGLISERWTNGISLVDINADGLTDIYVSNSILNTPQQRANEFFIHQGYDAEGYPIYKEEAEKMGLANTGLSTHTAFFDYDKDGDLDAYVLTNTMETFPHNTLRPKKKDGTGKSNDFLYRNNGDGTFTDVSTEAGITIEGYGLGIAITDINRDQWPDI
ncbi:MAG: VCBS repeat-containing protein, partial [Bacteroidetes bacterium]|nr:VCBS repeat-containing protein [Bacteroidota bacterium]